jgi:hypothetical protein
MSQSVCWGVYREVAHSPGRESDDARILEATAERLREAGRTVELLDAEALAARADADVPDLVFYMCERPEALEALKGLEARGARLVNPLEGVWNTYRERMLPALAGLGASFPQSRLVATSARPTKADRRVWVKRGDFHQTEKGDVVYARGEREVADALEALKKRGIDKAVLQQHVDGDLLKFYGVGRDLLGRGWFHCFPHKDQILRNHPYDRAALAALVEQAATLMRLEVFGGDVIVTKEGRLVVIDVNAWPSFALVRDEAATRIAAYLTGVLSSAPARARKSGGRS